MIQYIIWDAGGTLFDTYPAMTQAFQQSLAELGLTVSGDDILPLIKTSTRHALRTLAQTYRLDPTAFEAAYRQAYAAISPALQPPFPGVKKICAYICTVGGNFIVTHREAASLHGLLRAHGMEKLFVDLLTKESPFPRKPNPASLEAIIRAYQLDRSCTLAVGDRRIDITAAHAAHVRACFFGPQEHKSSADFHVTEYEMLYDLIRAENEDLV